MFQIGNAAQVIKMPHKYEEYDILGKTGIIVKTYPDSYGLAIKGYHNIQSSEGYFYFKENEIIKPFIVTINKQEESEMATNITSVVELWKKRNFERIDQETEDKLMENLAADDYAHSLILHMNELKDEGFKIEMPENIYDRVSGGTRVMKTIILTQAEEKKVQVNRTVEEINALLEMCDGNPEKEMEILCSYKIIEYPFGRMTVGGNICGK